MILNPLIGKLKLPGRVFQLPSRGLFYEPGVLAPEVKDGEIQVKPMSALTELKIRSADLLISTKVLGEVCVECAPEILNPGALLSRDVDAFFTFLVVSTYGSEKKVKANHGCQKSTWDEYQINLDPIISNPRNESLEHRDVIYSCDLPNGQVVKLKPVTFDDSITLINLRTALSRKEVGNDVISNQEIEKVMMADMMASIKSVDDGEISVKDPNMIAEWLRLLPRKYVDLIISAATGAGDWGFDFNVNLTCKHCHALFDYDIELNPINFFTG